jgi:predicted DNA-binding protein (MmcQ/YjbR family)
MLANLEQLSIIESYIESLDINNIQRDYPYSATLAVYSIENVPFAYLETGKELLRISLRSDPLLAKVLRDKYIEVLPGQKLNSKIWNTIVISGQLSLDEIKALILHSYQLAIDYSKHS